MTGVILGQVGTPSQPTPSAVRAYLARFLSDRRVVDYPPILWQPLLRGVILPVRGRRSARLYQRIWTSEGSPLLVESRKQCAGLQAALGERYTVVLGMAYAGPTFEAAVDTLLAAGTERIVVLPMFPQYSSSTTASIYDAVNAAVTGRAFAIRNGLRRFVPAISYVPPFYDEPAYIRAVAARIRRSLAAVTPRDKILLSFHGLPQRYIDSGDPYRSHCEATAQLLAIEMGWTGRDYLVSFQSRFGPEKWLEPETARVLNGFASRGVQSPLVVTPGFTTDCLETLDELGNEGRDIFVEGGGRAEFYQVSPCLNAIPEWIECMADLVARA